MSTQNYPTPWRVAECSLSSMRRAGWVAVEDAKGVYVIEVIDPEDADRIVAAVNGEQAWRQERVELVRALAILLEDAIASKLNEAGRLGITGTVPELEERFPVVFAHIKQARALLERLKIVAHETSEAPDA